MKYKFEIVKNNDVGFLMMSNNLDWVKEMLDKWKLMPPRFICINDDIDYNTNVDLNQVQKLFHDFFEILFPNKSTFEL